MIKTSKIIVNQAAVCACIGLQSSQVNKLEQDGIIIKLDHNKYDLVRSVRNYINHITGREASGSEGSDFYAERARLTKAQADERELIVLKNRGELVHIEKASQVWCDAAILLRNNILSVPPKVCRKAAELSQEAEIEEIIKDELIKALTSTRVNESDYFEGQEPITSN